MPAGFSAAWVIAAILCVVEGYLLGGIDFAIIISKRMYNTDVRTLGSGNAGMSNILRNFGKKGAVLTLLGDAGKGVVAVGLGYLLFGLMAGAEAYRYGGYFAAVAAIVGHVFPAWFHFKGGKGVSVALGVIITLQPVITLVLVAIFLACVLSTGMISLGSVVGISSYPVLVLIWGLIFPAGAPSLLFRFICALIIAALVVYMHRENIGRIRAGTEYRFGKKGKKQAPAPGAPQNDTQAIAEED